MSNTADTGDRTKNASFIGILAPISGILSNKTSYNN